MKQENEFHEKHPQYFHKLFDQLFLVKPSNCDLDLVKILNWKCKKIRDFTLKYYVVTSQIFTNEKRQKIGKIGYLPQLQS